MVIESIIKLISFLTIIPVGKFSKNNDLEEISKDMYLFPIIGIVIGIIYIPIVIFVSDLFDHLILGLIVTSFITILTGLHHTDALADFADGMMIKGNKEKKYNVIHDPHVGSAGVVAIITYFVGMIITISSYDNIHILIASLLISEVIAKYSMVLLAYFSQSAWEGYSSLFTKNMKSNRKMIISTIMTIITVIIIGQLIQVVLIQVLIIGVILGFIIIYISKKSFGGISGDVLGATNEIVRICCLLSSTIIK